MKTLQINRFGLEHLALAERAMPPVGDDQVLVRIKAFSLNYLDLLLVKGLYNPALSLPHVPGSDASGVVERVGSLVTTWKEGDEVITQFFVDWQDGPIRPEYFTYRLGSEGEGVFSQYVVLPQRALVAKPAYLSFVQAATLPIAGLTAWVSLLEEARITPGQTVLVQGSGGVALFVLQLARLAGARVIAISRTPEKATRLEALGAKHVVSLGQHPAWPEQVRELTGGRGVDVVVDTTGELDNSMQAAATGGFIKVVGFVATATPRFDVFTALTKNLTIKASTPGSKASFERLLQALTASQLVPVVDRVFPFGQAREAFLYLASGQHFGKVAVSLQEAD